MAALKDKGIAGRAFKFKGSAKSGNKDAARTFVQSAYNKRGGATKELKDIIGAYFEHERKRSEKA